MRTCPVCGSEAPPEARFCATCGAALSTDAAPMEERKLVTVLFADVTSSTQLGEQLDPEAMRALLRDYFDAMSTVIVSWGGTVEKFIGDAIMAVFGAPVAREDDPVRAAHAALEMLRRLETLNEQFRARHGVALAVRIGINTGEVIAPLDARSGGQLIVTGDAVNVAARLEQAAEPGTILVGERTYLAIRGRFDVGDAQDLAVRGKAEPIRAHRLLAVKREAAASPPELEAPMIGRDRELATITGLFDEAVESGRPRLVVIFGPAGIGKSRLLREFGSWAASAHPGLTVLRGRCLSSGQGITFWALGEILRSSCGISLDDSAADARDKLRGGVRQTIDRLDVDESEAERVTAALAATAGIDLGTGSEDAREPAAIADEMARAWPLFATGHASAGPLAIVIEDLHWADPELLAVLERILTRSDGPMLVVTTARPEFAEAHPTFAAGHEGASTVWLNPLTEGQSAELMAGLLGSRQLDALGSAMLVKAEGNPFFLEELVRALIDAGRLTRRDGGWQLEDGGHDLALPDTVHAVLAARIDVLPIHEKRTLQQASVVGRTFWEAPLGELVGDADVRGALLGLERRGLVMARPTSTLSGQPEFIFKHALVRDVAYASVPKARRARAHAEVGAWLERLAGDRADEFGELIADHYRMAVTGMDADLAWADAPDERERVRRRAVDALIRAGDAARRRFSERAFDLHDAALELAANDAERARVYEARGDDGRAFYRGDAAVAAFQSALEILRRDPHGRGAIARIAAKAGTMTQMFGAFERMPPADELEAIAAEGLAAVEDEPTRVELLIFFANLSRTWIGSRMGRLLGQDRVDPVPVNRRLAAAMQALEIAERLGLAESVASATDAIAELVLLTEDLAAYHHWVQRSLSMLDRIDSASVRADIMFEGSRERLEAGALGEAMELARRAVDASRELSPHERMHASYTFMRTAWLTGAWDDVLSFLDAHLEAARNEPNVSCTAVRGAPLIAARILVERGETQRATEVAPLPVHLPERIALMHSTLLASYAISLASLTLAREIVDAVLRMPRALLSEGMPAILDISAALGDWDRLEALLQRAREMAPAMGVLVPIIDRVEAQRIAARDGDRGKAIELLRTARDGYERMGAPYEAAIAGELLADLEPPDATAVREAAEATFRSLGVVRPRHSRVSP